MPANSATALGSTHPRLMMQDIDKSFGGVRVLSGVSLSVKPGEVVALLGANGAGKSTAMKILTGVYSKDAGEISINGVAQQMSTPRQAAALGISFLPQEISVIPDMSVAENICIADLPRKSRFGLRLVDERAAGDRATAILDQLGFGHVSPKSFIADLSIAERRIVEIARALASNASILVMDEPTASLTEQEAKMIFRIIRKLKAQQTSVIYISHYLKEVFEIADRIEVLRDGRNSGSFATDKTTPAAVVEAMLGKAAGALFGPREGSSTADAALLEIEGLRTRSGLEDIRFNVGKGEIVGVFGLVGSGVELLGRAIFSAERGIVAGKLTFDGKDYTPHSPQHAKATGIGFVTAERKRDGIVAELTVRENLALPFQFRHGRGIFASKAIETAFAERWIRSLRIKTNGPEQTIRTLSGGNQQKVCVARWLDPSVRMLILEEPTRGVDVGARRELYLQLTELARAGLAILVLSSDVEEVAGLCDRSMVIDRGRIVARFDTATEPNNLMQATAVATQTGNPS